MKEGIHPKYYPEAKVVCACGNEWVTGSTVAEIRIDICSKCHPFYTGAAMRIVDAGGQVERFTQRVEQARVLKDEIEQREAARRERARARQLVEIVDEEEEIQPIEGLAGARESVPVEDGAEEGSQG